MKEQEYFDKRVENKAKCSIPEELDFFKSDKTTKPRFVNRKYYEKILKQKINLVNSVKMMKKLLQSQMKLVIVEKLKIKRNWCCSYDNVSPDEQTVVSSI